MSASRSSTLRYGNFRFRLPFDVVAGAGPAGFDASAAAGPGRRDAGMVSQREIAKNVGCAVGLVGSLPAWGEYDKRRVEAGVRVRGRKAPKAVGLTEKMLASLAALPPAELK